MADVEDVMERGPRLKRGAICLVIGLGCAVSAYGALYGLARPDEVMSASVTSDAGRSGAYKFVWYFTALAFVVPVGVAWTWLTSRANRQWHRERFPEARLR